MGGGLLSLVSVLAVFQPALAQGGAGPQPGARIVVTADDLPEPYATGSASNPPVRVARPAGATLAVPEGFAVTLFADGLAHPRWLAVAANGDVFLAQSSAGLVTLLRDGDGDGVADERQTFARGLAFPTGMVIASDHVLVADVNGVWRFPYDPEAPSGGAPADGHEAGERLTPEGALAGPGGHSTRTLIAAPANHPAAGRLYVTVGSRSNLAEEPPPRATIQMFGPDGTALGTMASGLRNPVGVAFHPADGSLWTVVNERDGMGDRLGPDYLTRVEDGAFYGWPYAWLGDRPQPGMAERRPDLVARTRMPELLFEAHSAPLGLVFYDHAGSDGFPAEMRGDAFVALHGSWNRSRPVGYTVVRVRFDGAQPAGGYEVFASGFWSGGNSTAHVWGRPAGLAVDRQGGLLVADDVSGAVWRIAWAGN
ncbi:MAG: PQQ-dependent sugar dehydrogenase [Alphaproteobacteria bacterium]